MYPVSSEFQNKIKENDRTFKAEMEIQHSTGVLNLTDKDLVSGTLLCKESSQSGEEFTIGSTVASDISFTISNKPEYEDINFEGATVIPTIFLLLDEDDDRWEGVPLGRFNIDDPKKQRNTIEIKAIDNMIELDKPYSLSKLSYPANLYQIYTNICNVADIQVGTTSFPNQNYMVVERPDGDLTFRDVLGYVAELAGCFAKINRAGALEIKWYEESGLELGPRNRFDFKVKNYTVQIKGVMATVDNATYLAGDEDFAIDLTDNPLLQSNFDTVLPNIFNNIKDTVFAPFESSWQGDPALQAGDMITQVDRDGNVFETLVTSSTYKYRGASTLLAKGLPESAKGYKGSTNKRIANIVRKQVKPIGDQLTTLEQAQVNATELLANMLGGYIVKDDANGILYIADNPDISKAMKIWKYGIDGFGYSSNGVDGPYTTAVTADGSIVAMLVAANIITADMVQTGLLQSEDGSTWVNLDDGTFNLKDKVKYVNNVFSIDLDGEDLEGILGTVGGINLVSSLSQNWENGGLDNLGQPIAKENYIRTKKYYTHDAGNLAISFIKDFGYEVTIYLYDKNFVNYETLTISSEDAKGTFKDLPIGFFKIEVKKNGMTWGQVKSLLWSEVKTRSWAYFTKVAIPEVMRLKVENSDLPTSWTPSPHDTEEILEGKISEVKSEFKVTTDAIVGRVESTETDINDVKTSYAKKSEVSQMADSVIYNFTELQNMLGEDVVIESGNIRLSKDGIRVEHSDLPGEYSEMRADGFIRKYEYGEATYLNDIYIIKDLRGEVDYDNPIKLRINLPERFRERESIKVFLSLIDANLSPHELYGPPEYVKVTQRQEITLDVESVNVNTSTPYVDIKAYSYIETYTDTEGTPKKKYRRLSFDMIVLGY